MTKAQNRQLLELNKKWVIFAGLPIKFIGKLK